MSLHHDAALRDAAGPLRRALPMREHCDMALRVLKQRLETILSAAMRRSSAAARAGRFRAPEAASCNLATCSIVTRGCTTCAPIPTASRRLTCCGRVRRTRRRASASRWLTCTRLRDVHIAEFRQGLAWNRLLANILTRARREGVPTPMVYSRSLGPFLHEPGPLIGPSWEQERRVGRGRARLDYDSAFATELSVRGPVAKAGGQVMRMAREEDVYFTRQGPRPICARQTAFHLGDRHPALPWPAVMLNCHGVCRRDGERGDFRPLSRVSLLGC